MVANKKSKPNRKKEILPHIFNFGLQVFKWHEREEKSDILMIYDNFVVSLLGFILMNVITSDLMKKIEIKQ